MHNINVNFLLVKELIIPCIETFQLFLLSSSSFKHGRRKEKNMKIFVSKRKLRLMEMCLIIRYIESCSDTT